MTPVPTLHDLYPRLNEERLKEAEENLRHYLELVLRIYERVRLDSEAYARFRTLTAKVGTLSCTPSPTKSDQDHPQT